MQQITSVDQQAENFGVVATMQMRWSDPLLAFDADECQCGFRTFGLADFADYVSGRNSLWPDFTLFNQQGRRFTQNENIVVRANGDVVYLERLSATLQASQHDVAQHHETGDDEQPGQISVHGGQVTQSR